MKWLGVGFLALAGACGGVRHTAPERPARASMGEERRASDAAAPRSAVRPTPPVADLHHQPISATSSPPDPRFRVEQQLRAALAGAHRSDANRSRDPYRHPVETLLFFGLRPDMTVVQLWPGHGWYTEVLAPVLYPEGHLVVAGVSADAEGERGRIAEAFRKKLEDQPEVYAGVGRTLLQPPTKTELAEPGSADMVLTFRDCHEWVNDGVLETVFSAVFRVLRPGGVFGVVQHRAPADADPRDSAKRGYLPEPFVIEQARAAGFELDARAEINANPRDTKDYAQGVWVLPPTLEGGDSERERYLAIGESDRMTLRFVKPAAAAENASAAGPDG